MLKMYYQLPSGHSFAHVSRSCTTTLCAIALKNFWPERFDEWQQEGSRHRPPQLWMTETWANRLPPHCVVMVRNPVDRLNSLLSRNTYDHDAVQSVLEACYKNANISRAISSSMSLLTFHHLATLDWIADNDSQFCLFPEVEQACKMLGMEYEPSIHENKLNSERRDFVTDDWRRLLGDAMGIWEALSA